MASYTVTFTKRITATIEADDSAAALAKVLTGEGTITASQIINSTAAVTPERPAMAQIKAPTSPEVVTKPVTTNTGATS
jgi:glycine/D-amino acid oxidase-like deaminating enzyme